MAIGAIGAVGAIRVGLGIVSHGLIAVCCLRARWLTIVAFSKGCGQLLPDAVTVSLDVCRRVDAEFRVGIPPWELIR